MVEGDGPRPGKGRRIDKLMNAVAQGGTASEIEARLAASAAPGIEASKKGGSIEKRVKGILYQIDYVTGVNRTPKNSKLDQRGIDLSVSLNPQDLGFSHVKVQVKSSIDGIRKFKRAVMHRHGLKDAEELDIWLRDNRLIIINGQLQPEAIIQHFNSQIEKMKGHVRDRIDTSGSSSKSETIEDWLKLFGENS